MAKIYRINESHLPKLSYKTRESEIITETCNELIKNSGRISIYDIFDNISYVSTELYKQGYSPKNINESVSSYLKEDFFTGFRQTIKEKLFKWLLDKIDMPQDLRSFLVVYLSSIRFRDYSMFLSPLQNCEKIADSLVDGIMEWFATEGLKKWDIGGGFISDTIRNNIADLLLDKGVVQALQDKLNPVICDKIRGLFSN